jgi:hypothetical protein
LWVYPANKVGKRFLGATWDRALDRLSYRAYTMPIRRRFLIKIDLFCNMFDHKLLREVSSLPNCCVPRNHRSVKYPFCRQHLTKNNHLQAYPIAEKSSCEMCIKFVHYCTCRHTDISIYARLCKECVKQNKYHKILFWSTTC